MTKYEVLANACLELAEEYEKNPGGEPPGTDLYWDKNYYGEIPCCVLGHVLHKAHISPPVQLSAKLSDMWGALTKLNDQTSSEKRRTVLASPLRALAEAFLKEVKNDV